MKTRTLWIQTIHEEEARGNALLRVIKYPKKYYDYVMKDVNERELYELKCEFKDLKRAYEQLRIGLTKSKDHLNKFKTKMKRKDSNELTIVMVYFRIS